MSNYPSPYQPPVQQYYGYPPDLGKPARRASVLMIILGTLTLLLGACMFGAAMVVPNDQWLPEIQPQIAKIEAESGTSVMTLIKIAGGIVATPGLILIVLGLFVRRGGLVPAVLGVVITALMLLYFAYTVLQAVLIGLQGNAVGAFIPLVFSTVATALFGLQMYWLAKAVVNAGPLRVFNQHQQAYAWQMQQQSYAQQQQYRMPPPPPPPG